MAPKTVHRKLKDESAWLSLRIEPEHRSHLRRIAQEDGVSMSQVVRDVLECYLQADTEARREKEARQRA